MPASPGVPITDGDRGDDEGDVVVLQRTGGPLFAIPETGGVLHDASINGPWRDSLRRRCLAIADIAALSLAYLVTLVAFGLGSATTGDVLFFAVLPCFVVLNKVLRLYDGDAHRITKSTLDELPTLVQSVSLAVVLAFLLAPVTGAELAGERGPLLTFWAAACVLVPLGRSSTRRMVHRLAPPERVLIVGSGEVASLVARKLAAHAEYAAVPVGYLDAPREHDHAEMALPRLGGLDDFEAVCARHGIERVVVAFSAMDHEHLLHMIRLSKRLRLKISVVPRLFEVMGPAVVVDQVEGMTVLGLRGLTRTQSTLWLKRAMDVVGASVGLVLAAPVIAVAAVAVKLSSPGPVLYRQERIGRENERFQMLKLRTMVDGAHEMRGALAHLNEMDGKLFKIREDPRVTPVGRVLRRTSLDELPQLLNVLRGEMSLVGPRPLIPEEDTQIIGWHRARLDLTPGLTGPWQVLGRNDIPFDEMIKLDYLYVAEWSLWHDVKLLVRTLGVVVGRRGM